MGQRGPADPRLAESDAPVGRPRWGLRIDLTDEKEPILSGAIGVRAHRVSAWFDNIVVLPIDALPQSRSGKEDEL
jgi:hypothetical protein